MEREIIFRGRDKAGNWAEGFYCVFDGNAHRIYSGYAETDFGGYYPDYTIVDPKTVRQYTGMDDKNGRRIFEGDIVTLSEYGGGKTKSIVYFRGGKFAVDGSNYAFKDICPPKIEVIGNIYDNPELLKEE